MLRRVWIGESGHGRDGRLVDCDGLVIETLVETVEKTIVEPPRGLNIINEGTEQLQSGCIDYLVRTLKHQIIYISNSTQSPHM